jgi:hypothetical protein
MCWSWCCHTRVRLAPAEDSCPAAGNTSTYCESTDGAGYPQAITVNLGSAQSIGSITPDLPPSSPWSTRTETLSVLGSANHTTFSQTVASAGYTS